ncbi:MAG: hypothetical protein MI799_18695 [Desulfobacterales bacterium]|nr:hypothetical protein [Desulfobacterales bacterium]
MLDLRNFDWSRNKIRPRYYGGQILNCDFSDSISEKGFLVRGGVFEKCIFNNSTWWLSEFSNCKFIDCSFHNCRFFSCSLQGKFYNCSFNNISGKGEYFNFGWGSLYLNCIFKSVDLNNIGDIIGVKFENCKISGLISNGVLHGRRSALSKRFASLIDIFSRHYKPVKFIRCDLAELRIKNVVIENDVVFKKNKGFPQNTKG